MSVYWRLLLHLAGNTSLEQTTTEVASGREQGGAACTVFLQGIHGAGQGSVMDHPAL